MALTFLCLEPQQIFQSSRYNKHSVCWPTNQLTVSV